MHNPFEQGSPQPTGEEQGALGGQQQDDPQSSGEEQGAAGGQQQDDPQSSDEEQGAVGGQQQDDPQSSDEEQGAAGGQQQDSPQPSDEEQGAVGGQQRNPEDDAGGAASAYVQRLVRAQMLLNRLVVWGAGLHIAVLAAALVLLRHPSIRRAVRRRLENTRQGGGFVREVEDDEPQEPLTSRRSVSLLALDLFSLLMLTHQIGMMMVSRVIMGAVGPLRTQGADPQPDGSEEDEENEQGPEGGAQQDDLLSSDEEQGAVGGQQQDDSQSSDEEQGAAGGQQQDDPQSSDEEQGAAGGQQQDDPQSSDEEQGAVGGRSPTATHAAALRLFNHGSVLVETCSILAHGGGPWFAFLVAAWAYLRHPLSRRAVSRSLVATGNVGTVELERAERTRGPQPEGSAVTLLCDGLRVVFCMLLVFYLALGLWLGTGTISPFAERGRDNNSDGPPQGALEDPDVSGDEREREFD
ncbi:hypothetical protein [Neorickettsia sp. 179522]|uniref:hypothetical protein n=1 Tax=Neorickettsia sp. 179522 TaxID=1714371 RepID=UPI000792E5EB|nr:hypothetical protein [Neorickettsia sp. 179522]KYH12655.1 hypothetical protein AS219_02625 [Neorickettsia sp. 179522]